MRMHRRLAGALPMVAALLLSPAGLVADNCVWDNSTGDWTDVARWTTCGGSFPGAADDATVSGGSVTVTGSQAVTNFNLSGGTLTGAGTLTVSGAVSWTGGTMGGSGITAITAAGTLAISGAAVKVHNQRTINNAGTTTWTGTGDWWVGNGSVFNNQAGGTFDIQNDQTMPNNQGGSATFNNAGTTRKSAGAGNSVLGQVFNNTGTVQAQSGTLALAVGGTSTGSFTATSANTLAFSGGTHDLQAASSVTGAGTIAFSGATANIAGAYTVTGTTSISGGNANFNATATSTNANLSAGTLGGAGTLTVSGAFTWSGGSMTGSGITAITAAGTLAVGTANVKVQNQRTINNAGTTTWTGAADWWVGNGTVFNNQAGATFDIQTDQTMTNNQGGTATFNNAGTTRKSAGAGTSTLGTVFNNTSVVQAQSGTLSLPNGGTSTGSFTATSGDTLAFSGGTPELQAGSSVTGAGTIAFSGATVNIAGAATATGTNVNLSAGTLGGTGTLTVSGGTFNWTGGTMSGSGTTVIGAAGTLAVSGSVIKVQNHRTITNAGTTTWTGIGDWWIGNGSVFNNQAGATLDIQNDQTMPNNQGGSATFNNAGTTRKSAGTGTSSVGAAFNNTGTVQAQIGTLALGNGGTSTGSFTATSGDTLAFSGGTHDLQAASSVTGAGTIAFTGATANIAGTYSVTGQTSISGGVANFNATATSIDVNLFGSTLSGTGTLTVSGTLNWTSGTMSGAGTTAISAAGTLAVGSVNTKVQNQRTIINAGTANWTGTGGWFVGNGSIFNNQAGATFDIQNDSAMTNNQGGTATFNNAGTTLKSAGAGTSSLGAAFNNTGTVNANFGTLAFAGLFTQTAGETVLDGGNISTSSTLNIQGGTLRGAGTITGGVSNGGTVAPGLSPGILNVVGNYSQTAAGTLSIELNGTTVGTQYDQLNVTGTITLAGTLAITTGFVAAEGDEFTILANDLADAVSGTFAGLSEGAVIVVSSNTLRISYVAGTNNDVVLTAGPAVAAVALAVDAASGAGSDGNTVFEPGETVLIRPSWRNVGGAPVAFTASGTSFTGPAGATYTIADNAANYGTINPNATADCGSNCYSLFVTDPAARPATHWDSTFTETPNTSDPPKAWTVHLGDSFTDVPRSQLFYRRIETLVHTSITAGCGGTLYCPNDAVNRAQMSIFIGKGIAGGGPNIPASGSFQGNPYNCVNGGTSLFTDVTPTDIFCKHVHYMAIQNVTLGCGGGLYCPAGNISRSEMAVFVARAIVAPGGGAAVPETYTDPVTTLSYSCAAGSPNLHFTDIGVGDSFCKHVHFLWAQNIVSGCSATQYCPTLGVTRDQMARFLGNAFNLILYAP